MFVIFIQKALRLTMCIVIITVIIASQTFAAMNRETTYRMDGVIDIEKQSGHLCNTGAEMKQTIKGEGEMTKFIETSQVAGKLTVNDEQDWVTAADASRNLTVASVIELCSPPKQKLTTTRYFYSEEKDAWSSFPPDVITLHPLLIYREIYEEQELRDVLLEETDDPDLQAKILAASNKELWELATIVMEGPPGWWELFGANNDNDLEWRDIFLREIDLLTGQIWATMIEADPGHSGELSQDFKVAYGPYEEWLGYGPYPALFAFIEDEPEIHRDAWGLRRDKDDYLVIDKGKDYVGNYFNIEQFSSTTQGTTKRYIDISSPWSGAYEHEKMTVKGFAEVEDVFVMENLEPGKEAIPDWWKLF